MSCWLFFCGAIGKPRHPGIVRCRPARGSGLHFCEQARRHVPVLPGIGDHGDGLPVVARQDSHQLRLPVRVKFHAFSDAEIQHRAVRAHLVQESQPSHHLVIQLDEFGFRKRIYINARHGRFSPDQDSHILTENQGPAPPLKLTQRAQPSESEEALFSLRFADQIHSPASSAGNPAARLPASAEKNSLAPKFVHSCSPERGLPMLFLAALWLPILLSAVIVFVASSIMHMVLPYHKSDYRPLPDEDKLLDALRAAGVTPGPVYHFPHTTHKDMKSSEVVEKFKRGPIGLLTVMPSGPPGMGKYLGLWFVYCVVVSILVAIVAGART